MSRFSDNQVQDALAVVGQSMAGDFGIRVIWGDEKRVSADIQRRIVRLPRLACASMLGVKTVEAAERMEMALTLTRANAAHEFGHCAFTNLPKEETPKGALFSILNSLEDVRMEREVAENRPGYREVFATAENIFNKRIAGEVADGKTENRALWEAMCACSFQVSGIRPAWTLRPEAQQYFDLAYPIFSRVVNADNTRDCLKLAQEIFAKLNEQKQQEKKQEKQQDEKQEKKKQQGQQESGGDFAEQDDSQDDSQDNSQDNEADEGDEDKADKEEGEDKADNEAGEGDEEDKADKEAGEDKADKEAGEGDEGDEEGEGEEAEDEGDEEGEEGEGDEGENEDEDGEGDEEGEAEEGEGETGEGKVTGKQELTDEEKAAIEQELDEQAEGKSLTEMANDEIEKALSLVEMSDSDVYTSRRDLDLHNTPNVTDQMRKNFSEVFARMQQEVAMMALALEQALRALTRCRKDAFLRTGRMDNDRLVEIAKNLSRQVFYQQRKGRKLDTAVALVVDESGSMSDFAYYRDLIILLGECLYRLGVPFEVIGTTTNPSVCPPLDGFSRTKGMVYAHYKQFEEAWPVVKERLMSLSAHDNNIDGEAVEFEVRRLLDRKEARKIVFSLCDGQPCGGQNNNDVLAKNIKRVAELSRKLGVEVYGVGIGTKAPERFYGENYFIYLEREEHRGEKFIRAFSTILTNGGVRM